MLILHPTDKIRVEEIDTVTSAIIPDKKTHPNLYDTVATSMIHGPCGKSFPKAQCNDEFGNCTKGFPKKFANETTVPTDGYIYFTY